MITDDYEEKRKKCDFHEPIEFNEKPELASEMLNHIVKNKLFPFKYIAADSVYGNSLAGIEAVCALIDVIFFVSIPSTTRCRIKNPKKETKTDKYKGKKTRKKVVSQAENSPITVESIAKNLNDYFWYRRTISEGTKGPMEYEFAKKQITLSNDGRP